jgi:fatty acid desaturase
MSEILPIILLGIFVVLMLLVVVNFTLESWKSDQEYQKAIREIQERKHY